MVREITGARKERLFKPKHQVEAHRAGEADPHGRDGGLASRDAVPEEAKQAPAGRRLRLDGEQAERQAAAVLRREAEEQRLEEGVVAPVRHGRAILAAVP